MRHVHILLLGPTGAGKSSLGHRLALHLNAEIISADSVQIYKGMDRGTAKPDSEMRAEVPYHLLDILDPSQTYSAAQFVTSAHRALAEIRERGNRVIIVGGTMLYIDSLLKGISALPPSHLDMRARYIAYAQKKGWKKLHQRLQNVDATAARRIHWNDHQRLLRALEVVKQAGCSMTELHRQGRRQGLYSECAAKEEQLFIGVLDFPQREQLYDRLATRFMGFINDGLVEEVRQLKRRKDLSLECSSIRAVGYRQIWEYLDGLYNYEEMLARCIAATRQLAKKQLTWLRNWDEPVRPLDARLSLEQLTEETLKHISRYQ